MFKDISEEGLETFRIENNDNKQENLNKQTF